MRTGRNNLRCGYGGHALAELIFWSSTISRRRFWLQELFSEDRSDPVVPSLARTASRRHHRVFSIDVSPWASARAFDGIASPGFGRSHNGYSSAQWLAVQLDLDEYGHCGSFASGLRWRGSIGFVLLLLSYQCLVVMSCSVSPFWTHQPRHTPRDRFFAYQGSLIAVTWRAGMMIALRGRSSSISIVRSLSVSRWRW